MGEDNRLKSMYIKDNCLRFEMEAILRTGKFLGNHYLSFTVPQKALIITVDRVKEGMKAARRRKKALKALLKAQEAETDRKAHHAEDALALDDVELSSANGQNSADKESDATEEDGKNGKETPTKGFISRFVDGYVQAGETEASKERLAHAISDWFGRQGVSDTKSKDKVISKAEAAASNPESEIAEAAEEILETTSSGNDVSKVVEEIAFEQLRQDEK